MNEVDKIINKLSAVMGWLRSGKEDESIRAEMYSSATKVCQALADQIEQLTATEKE